MEDFAAICTFILSFLLGAVLAVLLLGTLNSYGEEDIRAACVRHGGVAQLSQTPTTFSLDYGAIVVCKDGSIEGLK